MKIGSMNDPTNNLIDEINIFGNIGLDYLDLTVEYPEATPEKILSNENKIKNSLSKFNLTLMGHMPWYFQIAYPYEEVRKSVLKETERIIGVLPKFDIQKITLHPDPLPIQNRKLRNKVFQKTADSIKYINKLCNDNNITLSIENFTEEKLSTDELKVLFEKIPELRMTLDIGHGNLDFKNGERIFNLINTFREKIIHCHVHDNRGKEDEHLPIGAGYIDWPKVTKAIKNIGYDDTFTLEIHANDREYLKISKEKFLNFWNKN